MDSWSDGARAYKRKRATDPDERIRRKQRVPSRKTLLDRLDSARGRFLWYLEIHEDPRHRDTWWDRGRDWALERYAAALQACWDAGVDVKS